MAAAARARAIELFSLDDMVTQTIEHYRRLGLQWPLNSITTIPYPQILPVTP